MQKEIIYFLLLLCNILMCLSLSVITPFFPPFAMERDVTEEVVGLIISANPIGAFFASLTLGKILNDKNRFFYMILGLIMQAFGMFLFGSTYYFDGKTSLISIAIFARIMSGLVYIIISTLRELRVL